MTKIYLIRHAEAEGNLYRRIHGWYDSTITQNGWMQISALRKRFCDIHIDTVYSSDLIRTQMTASAIFLSKGLPLYSTKGLREVGMGIWEDMTWGDAELQYPEQIRYFTYDQAKWDIPGCESFDALQHRIFDTISELAEQNDGKSIAIVSHGTAIRAFIARLLGVESCEIGTVTHCDNTAVTLLTYCEGAFSLKYYGDVEHLPSELRTVSTQNWWKSKDGCDSSNLRYYKPASGADLEFAERAVSAKNIDMEHVFIAAHRETPVGLLSLDMKRSAETGIGWIKDYYILPDYIETRFAPQLIGQAISVMRPIGYERLGVSVSSDNIKKSEFFRTYGFTGDSDPSWEQSGVNTLMMDISYNWRKGKKIIYV